MTRTGATAVVRLACALLLAAAVVLLPAGGARAAGEPGLERPTPSERVTQDGPYQITGYVDAGPGEEVRAMEARLLFDGTQLGSVRNMDFIGSQETGPGMRRTRWAVALDPLRYWEDAQPLLNGRYRVEVRATVVFQSVPREPTAWRGVDFVIDVDPPATTVQAKVLDAAQRRVEVSWEPVLLPDFVRYVVQRKIGAGDWKDYREVPSAEGTRWADVVPGDGEFAYRVQTYRRAAGDGERKSPWSAPANVSVRKPPPPAPPSESGEGGAGAAAEQGPPVLRVRTPPPARPPAFTGPDTYEETLDYGDTEVPLTSGPEQDLAQDEAAEELGELRVREDRDFPVRQALVPVAAGLVLTVSAWHLRRFLRVSA
ncbi:MAG TPA: hypothetical protein VNU01_00500 [Egibacteraceae bacterium]|nr:hypothetical protein [Egibacteraceae bacterium]